MSTKFVQIKALGLKLAPPQRNIDFPYMNIVKTLKSSFKELKGARAKIFSMKHVLMDLYQVCSNKSPWVIIGPAPGGIDFPNTCIATTLKSSSKKPE
jgi:hypothetical protein